MTNSLNTKSPIPYTKLLNPDLSKSYPFPSSTASATQKINLTFLSLHRTVSFSISILRYMSLLLPSFVFPSSYYQNNTDFLRPHLSHIPFVLSLVAGIYFELTTALKTITDRLRCKSLQLVAPQG